MSDTSGVDPSSFDPTGGSNPFSDFFSSVGSGISNLFSGNAFGGSSLSDLASQAGGGGQSAATQTNVTSADNSVIDPSTVAQAAITDGQAVPTNAQNQNPQGQQDQKGQGQNSQPQSAVDALKKALTNLRQRQRQNPWQLGQGGPNTGLDASMLNRAARIPTGAVPPAPIRSALDPSQANAADIPSANAMEVAMQTIPNTAQDQADIAGSEGPVPGEPTQAPPWWKWSGGQPFSGQPWQDTDLPGNYSGGKFTPASPGGETVQGPMGPIKMDARGWPAGTQSWEDQGDAATGNAFSDYLKGLRGGGGGPGPVPGGPATPQAQPRPTFQQGQPIPGAGGLNPIELIKRFGPIGALIGSTTPAETGELPPQTLGRKPSGPEAPLDPEIRAGGPGHGATTRAPLTGKPVQTVDPKTKKPVDPKTGEKLPTKKEDLPTKKGHYEPATGDARDKTWVPGEGHGPIMRDIAGMQSVPPMLGQLAQMAMPLLMAGLMGGFGGGGRHGRHGGFGFGGRHGGFRGHGGFMGHPGYGRPGFGERRGFTTGPWRGYRGQPSSLAFAGGGFQPGGGGQGGLEALLPLLGLGGQNQQGGGNQQDGGGQRYGQGNHFGGGQDGNPWGFSPPGTQGPWSQNPVLNTLVGAESSGRNSGAPGEGPGGDGGVARGYYNIQTPTWQEFARGVPGASQYATADQAPPEVQTQVAMTIPVWRFGDRTRAILHQQFGDFSERMTIGELASQHGDTTQIAKGGGKSGTTPTGGSTSPNPAAIDTTPPYKPTQMGAEAGAEG